MAGPPLRDYDKIPGFVIDHASQQPVWLEGQANGLNTNLYAWSPTALSMTLLTVDASGNLNVSTGATGGGGGAATIADGADVAEGSKADAAWTGSGAGTVIAILKKIASAGGSAVSIADGADTAEGSTADAAWTASGSSTVISLLKRMTLTGIPVSQSGNITVGITAGQTIGVTGTFWQATQPVSQSGNFTVGITSGQTIGVTGTFWQATQPISITSGQTVGLVSGSNTIGNVGIVAGTAVIGHMILDSGSVNAAVTGTVTANSSSNTIGNVGLVSGSNTVGNVGLVSGSNTVGNVGIVSGTNTIGVTNGPPLTKGTQATSGYSVQNLKDAGRTYMTIYIDAGAGTAAEALLTMNINKAGTVSTATGYSVTSGKTLRLSSFMMAVKNTLSTAAVDARCRVRANATTVSAASSIIVFGEVGTELLATNAAGYMTIPFIDGYELPSGTSIGMTHVDSTTSCTVSMALTGYEY